MAERSSLLEETVQATKKLINRRQELEKIERRANERRTIREAQASQSFSGETEPSDET